MHRLLLWAPRLLGVLMALFVGAFALDALEEGRASLIIDLVPALALLVIVALSWRWKWLGGGVFCGVALFHAADTMSRPDWVLAISGPSLVIGMLFLVSWHELELAREPGAERP